MIPGKIKIALTLQMLPGGLYLDLSPLYKVGFTYGYNIFHYVIEHWICHDQFVNRNFKEYLDNDKKMWQVAGQFAERTNGVLGGCIGALDGWLVVIKKPNKKMMESIMLEVIIVGKAFMQ